MRRLSRRHFLRGLAGSAVALPLLEMGLPQQAFAQAMPGTMTADGFPKRFIYFYHPNGTQQDTFWPTAGTSPTDFALSEILSPLVPNQDKIIITKGVDLQAAAASAGPGGPHQRGMGGVLTGMPLQEGTFVGGDGSLAGWASGISIDQVLANRTGSDTAFKSLQFGIRADTTAPTAEVRTRLSYAGPAQPLPPQNDPAAIFTQLFSDFATNPDELSAVKKRRKSVLDAVSEQFNQINARAGYEDRIRLESHLAMVRDLELRLDNERVTGDACYAPTTPGDNNPDDEDVMPEITRLQIDMLVMAMACDLTRVGGLQFSNAKNHIRFPWIESLGDGHQLSHAGPSNTSAHAEWVARDKWFATQFNYLLTKLDSVQEGENTMLHNTCVLWVNELSQGNTHAHNDMPFVLAGSAGGHFKTGQFVEYTGASSNDLLVSIQQAFGIEEEVFGSAEFSSGPLAGLTL